MVVKHASSKTFSKTIKHKGKIKETSTFGAGWSSRWASPCVTMWECKSLASGMFLYSRRTPISHPLLSRCEYSSLLDSHTHTNPRFLQGLKAKICDLVEGHFVPHCVADMVPAPARREGRKEEDDVQLVIFERTSNCSLVRVRVGKAEREHILANLWGRKCPALWLFCRQAWDQRAVWGAFEDDTLHIIILSSLPPINARHPFHSLEERRRRHSHSIITEDAHTYIELLSHSASARGRRRRKEEGKRVS
jgi:hypothetical protein